MSFRVRVSPVSILVSLVALAAPAFCQSQPSDYSLDLTGYCMDLCANVSSGFPNGGPASGSATFEAEQVSFIFETLAAIWYQNGEDTYYAQFGYGGTFDLTAPMGTFEGVITSGSSQALGASTSEAAQVSFDGYWD